MPNCVVCEVEGAKYTCPKCSSPFCSVPCFQEHKEKCVPKKEEGSSSNNSSSSGSSGSSATSFTAQSKHAPPALSPAAFWYRPPKREAFDDCPSVDEEALQSLSNDEHIQQLMQHSVLRQQLRELLLLDGTTLEELREPSASLEDEQLRRLVRTVDADEDFAAFVDRVLKAAGVRDSEGNCLL
eukprot:TRINITY_DN24512_c0_g1_i1.p2 TRINITY_DN24512_c0_g1~~TRINITY_DN24512_c0_g1_i1.p2  ORF type:complete len:183 (-),score=63.80 TRINITY_DN24512_c0_g1_i1:40-588(-)